MYDTETLSPTPVLTLRSAGAWMLTFAGFPLGSVAARLVAGPIDGPTAALVGGLVSGAVLGAFQAWGLGRHRPAALAWVVATAVGLSLGLLAGAAAVDYGTGMSELVLQGVVCGFAVGLAQAVVLVRRVGTAAFAWPFALGAAWGLGWAITTALGVEVDEQFTVFGSSGAITVTALTLVLPALVNRKAEL